MTRRSIRWIPSSSAARRASRRRARSSIGPDAPCRGSPTPATAGARSEEHTSELQSRSDLVCRLLLEKKKKTRINDNQPEQHLAANHARPNNRQRTTHADTEKRNTPDLEQGQVSSVSDRRHLRDTTTR